MIGQLVVWNYIHHNHIKKSFEDHKVRPCMYNDIYKL